MPFKHSPGSWICLPTLYHYFRVGCRSGQVVWSGVANFVVVVNFVVVNFVVVANFVVIVVRCCELCSATLRRFHVVRCLVLCLNCATLAWTVYHCVITLPLSACLL